MSKIEISVTISFFCLFIYKLFEFIYFIDVFVKFYLSYAA